MQAVDADLTKLTESLKGREYDTATSGSRQVEPCRSVGEGGGAPDIPVPSVRLSRAQCSTKLATTLDGGGREEQSSVGVQGRGTPHNLLEGCCLLTAPVSAAKAGGP